ncbi:hypothetical protein ABG984_05865 [Collinsella aerofaciens]|jgi:hypothetical protein|uniref:hypothetical protein n=1 Tax=Collinsella aerofaciens TaxID=74426 RepID=UPI00325B19A6
MDSNAIKEIANQLGVGADYLLNHLSEFAPKWAIMQAAKSGVSCVFLVVALAVAIRILMWVIRSNDDSDTDYCHDVTCCFSDDSVFVIIPCGIVALCLFIALMYCATDLVAHIASPEATMLNDMLQAVH